MNKTYIIPLAALVLVGIGLYTISDKRAATESQANVSGFDTTSDVYTNNQNTPMEQNTDTSTSSASNLVAQNGDVVAVQYTGKLQDGTVFDSSVPRGQPFVFQLGAGMVIQGWEKGILGMKIGEKKTLTISPEDGYGAEGVKDPQTGKVVIPGNATLIFDVELVDMQRR